MTIDFDKCMGGLWFFASGGWSVAAIRAITENNALGTGCYLLAAFFTGILGYRYLRGDSK